MSTLLEQLNKTYFWDIDPGHLDELKSKKIIIERVMNFGDSDLSIYHIRVLAHLEAV